MDLSPDSIYLGESISSPQLALWLSQCKSELLQDKKFTRNWYIKGNEQDEVERFKATETIDAQRAHNTARRYAEKTFDEYISKTGYNPSIPLVAIRTGKVGTYDEKKKNIELKLNSQNRTRWPNITSISNTSGSFLMAAITKLDDREIWMARNLGTNRHYNDNTSLHYHVTDNESALNTRRSRRNKKDSFYISLPRSAAYALALEQQKSELIFRFNLKPESCEYRGRNKANSTLMLKATHVSIYSDEISESNLIYSM
uniref:Uncharacterized protein n=2 Tax=Pseudoalteromonas rubra TaxID=43658 RepID=A0A0F4QM12_9GAMM|nr:hypothetical protein TW77_11575 [Pseudoalteromonas rubra]